MSWRDLTDERYRLDWQQQYSLGARAKGMFAAAYAQRHISALRAIQRKLRNGDKLTWRDWRKYFGKLHYRTSERWILDRSKKRLDRAISRGDALSTMKRRGLLDPLRGHQQFRGVSDFSHPSRGLPRNGQR